MSGENMGGEDGSGNGGDGGNSGDGNGGGDGDRVEEEEEYEIGENEVFTTLRKSSAFTLERFSSKIILY